MALPIFKATVLAVRNYDDSNTTKVIVRPTAMTVNGDITDLDKPENRALDAKPTCFRLQGSGALDRLAQELTEQWQSTGLIKANQHVSFKPGNTIYFQGLGPGEWDGQAQYKDEELLTMLRVLPDSISGAATTKIRRVMTAGVPAEQSTNPTQGEPVEA